MLSVSRRRYRAVCIGLGLSLALWGPASLAHAAEAGKATIHADRPNVLSFAPQKAKFVRCLILRTSGSQACLDELEVFGPDGKRNLALERTGARATASSSLTGYAQHAVEHLNDGLYGNAHSWIPATEGQEWAQIELPQALEVSKVVFSRDREREYADRVPLEVEVRLSDDGKAWRSVQRISGVAGAVALRRIFGSFSAALPSPPPPPQIARDGSVAVTSAAVDLKVAAQDSRGLPNAATVAAPSAADLEKQHWYALLGEEHAWLKTYGRADLSPRLVPYNGRVKEYPRHVGDDCLPLPPLSSVPKLDGKLDDPCWNEASRCVVRVAWPFDSDRSPLVTCSATAGRSGDSLYLAMQTDRPLSSHVAVVSSADGRDAGVVAITSKGMVFNTYEPEGRQGAKLKESKPVEGSWDKATMVCEFRLPLAWFPECTKQGLRVGLGMGGKHTAKEGRPVRFVVSPVSIAEVGPCVNRQFRVRVALSRDGKKTRLVGNAAELKNGIDLAPGETKTLVVAGERGPIGPQLALEIEEEGVEKYTLQLFRYDPLERIVTLTEAMLDRFVAKGLDVSGERAAAAALRTRQAALLASAPDLAAERQATFEARLAKRRLFFRDPDLASIEKILFVKRHAYEPSHNYSVLLDSAWRPGGGVYRLDIPKRSGRFLPDEASPTRLFDSRAGISRDPVATFDLSKILFGYRPSQEGYYHIMRMNPDGSGMEQLTTGPFHDYWPCPLPDGGIAFIGTRCKARYLCWRPQVSVLFRMDADGENIEPLSYANLSEWAPSVTSDGRILWTRSEYIDKGADFSHTLWFIRPDGTQPELVFGNTILQPNGYANGREVPGTPEICCTLISHFGDLNGPISLVDTSKGRFNPAAITSITPEVPWPGMWPDEEAFRDPFPIARDYFLCSHAPRRQFALYVIDRYGNREVLHQDHEIGSMCPIPYRAARPSPVLATVARTESHVAASLRDAKAGLGETGPREETPMGELVLADVYRGIEGTVPRGKVKFLRVVEEVRAGLQQLPGGEYRKDHDPFMHFYAAPVDIVSGPFGWPSYVAKASWGLVPVEEDGSARFYAPAGKTLYFQALDEDLNEIQRMRSVVQLQPGEKRSCIGCHEDRRQAPPARAGIALRRPPHVPEAPPWGTGPFSYEKAVQPVLDRRCVECHHAGDKNKINLAGTLDVNRVPVSYRTLIQQGWVHFLDCGWNSGGNEKRDPLTFGTVKSKLWPVLNKPDGHHGVRLTRDEMHTVKCWTDMNCPLWGDYIERTKRPMVVRAQ